MNPLATDVPDAAAETTQRHLILRAGEYLCALPLSSVRRVVRALSVRPLPGSSDELRGLAEFAGEPLPVLDLARLLDAPPGATSDYPVTVVAWAGPDTDRELVGLNADAALEVAEIPVDRVVAGSGGVVFGEVSLGDDVARVINLRALGGEA